MESNYVIFTEKEFIVALKNIKNYNYLNDIIQKNIKVEDDNDWIVSIKNNYNEKIWEFEKKYLKDYYELVENLKLNETIWIFKNNWKELLIFEDENKEHYIIEDTNHKKIVAKVSNNNKRLDYILTNFIKNY